MVTGRGDMTSKASYLERYVDAVVDDFVAEVDPNEKRYKTHADLGQLRADLTECIEGAVVDWKIEQREKLQAGVQR